MLSDPATAKVSLDTLGFPIRFVLIVLVMCRNEAQSIPVRHVFNMFHYNCNFWFSHGEERV